MSRTVTPRNTERVRNAMDIEYADELIITFAGTVTLVDEHGVVLSMATEGFGDVPEEVSVTLSHDQLVDVEIRRVLPEITEPQAMGAVVEAIDTLALVESMPQRWDRYVSVEPVTVENRWYRVGSHFQDGLCSWKDFVATRLPSVSGQD
jgi:hypothetical protein